MRSPTHHGRQADPSGAFVLLRYALRMFSSANTDGARRLFAIYASQATRRLDLCGMKKT